MIGQVFMFNAFLRSGYLVVSGNQKIIMITTAISALFNIFLNYILIQRYGTLGAALSTSFAQFLSLVLLNFFFPATRKIFYLQIKSLLIIPYLFKKRIDK
jgi:PST family polysaccharide transporter